MKIRLYEKGFENVKEKITGVAPKVENTRGEILRFSKESRLRLRRFLLEKHVKGCETFGLTLTVPSQDDIGFVVDAFNVAVHRLRVYFVRFYPRYGFVWRIELQRNRMPHLHLICYGNDTFGVASGFVLRIWHDIVCDLFHVKSDFDFLSHGLKCTILDGHIAAFRYLADHTGKRKQAQLGWKGRQWGVVGRRNFCEKDFIDVEIPPCVTHEFRRMVRRVLSFAVKCPCVFGRKIVRRKSCNAVSYLRKETIRKWLEWRTAQFSFCKGCIKNGC